VPVPFEVATALKELPKVALAVWLGGVPPVPLVKVIVGVAATTVMVRFDEPAT
jgi:hypothetical protein